MSARALRKLREDREKAEPTEPDISEEDEDEEEEKPSKGGAFLSMMDDSSDDSSDEDEEEEEKAVDKHYDPPHEQDTSAANDEEEVEEEEEDLDAILDEFKSHDDVHNVEATEKSTTGWFHQIVHDMDIRDLDVEYVMRTNLMGAREPSTNQQSTRRTKGNRQNFLFGPPKDGWNRPPHYVGGGMGMKTYKEEEHPLPWPYNLKDALGDDETPRDWKNLENWYSFVHSDTYTTDLEFFTQIRQSGDANALALFVADNPYVPEALYQLSTVVYMSNHGSQDGQALLRRSLWTFECAASKSFVPQSNQSVYVDGTRKENESFFRTLFRMVQVSSISGCIRTSLAISRYLLAMDPLRDPMAVLITLDYYAMACLTDTTDNFVVNLVECEQIKLYHQDSDGNTFVGDLLDMPNWAFSYALALYRLGCQEKATLALVAAVDKFPFLVEQLLQQNDVDTSGRSMRTDWPTVLKVLEQKAAPPSHSNEFDPILYHASKTACNVVCRIFVKRSYKLWGNDVLQNWLFAACKEVIDGDDETAQPSKGPSPALQRYANIDPTDFEDRFHVLPAEANPLDAQMLAFAMNVDPNRRRLLQRGGAARMEQLNQLQQQAAAFRGGGGHGMIPGTGAPNWVDPDSPLMEVFLQSLLPWNEVEGVAPAGP